MSDERFAVQRTQITSVGRMRTALMLTDIVGYSRRMHLDETNAVRELRQHNDLVREALNTHRGREVKTIGDAFLAEFASADDALRCALAIHKVLEQAFTGADPLRVRIGLHVAEVEAIGPDVIGDGVNILSRIEPHADPGGVCASREFIDELEAPQVEFASIGPVEMKNITRPVELLLWPSALRPSEPTVASTGSRSAENRRTSNSLPVLAAAAAAASKPRVAPPDEPERTELGLAYTPSIELSDVPMPTRASALTVMASAPDPQRSSPSTAKPLSRGSGIFAPKNEEPFADSTAIGRPASETRAAPGPLERNSAPTVDLSGFPEALEEGTHTGPSPVAGSWPEPQRHESGERGTGEFSGSDLGVPDVVVPPPHRPREMLIAMGTLAGVAVALTLGVIYWMVTGPHPDKNAEPVATTVVTVAQPAPVAAPPPPVAAPTPPPPVAAPAPPPAVAAPPPPTTIPAQLEAAKANIQKSHLKPNQKKALLADLNKLNKKYTHAHGKDKKKAESALRSYIKKHKLL